MAVVAEDSLDLQAPMRAQTTEAHFPTVLKSKFKVLAISSLCLHMVTSVFVSGSIFSLLIRPLV